MSCNKNCLCKKLKKILKADEFMVKNNICIIDKDRKFKVKILGKRTKSPLVIENEFTFKPVNSKHSLCLAELVLKQKEVRKVIDRTSKGIIISALHNHWLFEHPRLMYLHLEAVQKPREFAKKVAHALKGIK